MKNFSKIERFRFQISLVGGEGGGGGADDKWYVPVIKVTGKVIRKCSPMRSPEIYTYVFNQKALKTLTFNIVLYDIQTLD